MKLSLNQQRQRCVFFFQTINKTITGEHDKKKRMEDKYSTSEMKKGVSL